VFNIEGGCYAKTIRLNPELEPLIWTATRRFATVLENASIRTDTRRVDFDDVSLTENTRAAYPLGFIENHEPSGRGGIRRVSSSSQRMPSGCCPRSPG